jgi:hypothetical protein
VAEVILDPQGVGVVMRDAVGALPRLEGSELHVRKDNRPYFLGARRPADLSRQRVIEAS